MPVARFGILVLLIACIPVQAQSGDPGMVGVNLLQNYDWNRQSIFADLMKQARGWGSVGAAWDLTAPVDANGWPTADAAAIFVTNGVSLGGTYRLSYTGRATVSAVASPLTVRNAVYSTATNASTADVVVDAAATQIILAFRGTSGGVRNVRLMRPGYTTETFTRGFLDLVRPYSLLRTMEVMCTSGATHVGYGNVVSNWSDRTLPTYATQNRLFNGLRAGIAWEYVIDLANLLDKDLWVNIPDLGTDDYARQLATLLRDRLEPERRIYVEYSNEVWNPTFESHAANLRLAEAEVAAGGSNLNADGDTDHEHWGFRRTARRTREIEEIFRSVFGASAMLTRVRPILAGHFYLTDTFLLGIDFLERNYGPARNVLYAVTVSQYLELSRTTSARTDLTVDGIIAEWTANLPAVQAWAVTYSGIARYYGLHLIAYEGSVLTRGPESNAAKVAANRDSRVRGLVSQLVRNFLAAGGETFCYFGGASPYDQYGAYGITDDVAHLDTPKRSGLADVLAAPRPSITAGTAVPGTVEAGSYAIRSGGLVGTDAAGGTFWNGTTEGAWATWLVRVPTRGVYRIAVQAGAAAAGGRLEILVNDVSIQTIDVPATGGQTTWSLLPAVQVTLDAGLQAVRVRVSRPAFAVRSLRVTQ